MLLQTNKINSNASNVYSVINICLAMIGIHIKLLLTRKKLQNQMKLSKVQRKVKNYNGHQLKMRF